MHLQIADPKIWSNSRSVEALCVRESFSIRTHVAGLDESARIVMSGSGIKLGEVHSTSGVL